MFKKLLLWSEKKWYWIAFLFLGLGFEATALYYQYVLEYMPCVICIHVRIWVLALIMVSLLALMVYKNRSLLLLVHILMVAVFVGMVERSYQLLGIERGFIMGNCSMDSGLPAWFALDEWLPSVFKVWEPCGYTPEILFDVTMAEFLIVFSSLFLILNVVLLSLFVFNKMRQ